jgi:hypothetical protein
VVWPLWIFALLLNRGADIDCVTYEDRPYKTHAIVTVRHCARIDVACGHSNGHAQNQGAVSDSALKGLRKTPGFIHVMRIEVSGLTGVQDDVSFSHCSPARRAPISDCVLLQKHFLNFHRSDLNLFFNSVRTGYKISFRW